MVFSYMILMVMKMATYKRNFVFPENVIETIVTNIIKYRKEANITQEQLALDIDISYDHIRRMESTKGSEGLALETFIKISIVLGKNLDDFLK